MSSLPQNKVAAEVIAKSFLHYRLMQYAFEGQTETQRQQLLNRLYKRCINAASMYGGVLTTPDAQGAVIWLLGKNFPLNLLQEARSGMITIPFEVGLKPTLRLMQHDGESEGWICKHTGQDIGYIWCVGVLPQARGKGYSRLLIEQSMEQMRSQNLNTCWLKTEDPVNVAIYQKLGFTLMNEMKVKSSGITSWALMKKIE